ncbi:histidine phosphatase family protein [Actinotignum sanguinis]|uniref:histidine phosphatase family protein n=1 Tax=Actinotignum sanguinis TaxID=1445614 RepID=UPI000F7E1B73|nr:histidine phosphatase family protein [Actinotignum sanguinis]MDY5148931.1 histidine phosphatase family protein [Actinotignum sanguinis]RTE47672.1 histidine phosphatase family protein [Actinotignum sanguinis]
MIDVTVVHLVRHGEVDNPSGELYGRQPGFHLTDLGREMAGSVRDFFRGHDVRAVISSPLERAIETATPTAHLFDLEISTDANLIEAGNNFEGINVNRNRWILASPKFWPWYINPFRPSWGEPYTDIAARMTNAVRSGLAAARGGEAVLVSHQLPIWTLRSFVEGRSLAHDPRRRQCALCSVTSLTFQGTSLVAVDYAEPAAELLARARDITPGISVADENRGD